MFIVLHAHPLNSKLNCLHVTFIKGIYVRKKRKRGNGENEQEKRKKGIRKTNKNKGKKGIERTNKKKGNRKMYTDIRTKVFQARVPIICFQV